jgi:class 3 adenylate cyclase
MMARLTADQRANLPDRAFAYVDSLGRRRLPIHDEAHVRNALARFERVAFESDAARERARKRLLAAAKKYGVVPVGFITGQFELERSQRSAERASLPTGSVTFLMLDIEGSTALLHRLGDEYAGLLVDVRRLMRRCVLKSNGHEVDARADEYFAVFQGAGDAVTAALAIHRRLAEHPWPDGAEVRVRAGVHGGRPTLTDAGYVGLAVHTTARICATAKGGQTLVSARVHAAIEGTGVRMQSRGVFTLRDIPEGLELFEVGGRTPRS